MGASGSKGQHGTVVVVGGGYAGCQVARSLDKDFNVVLIDPKEYSYHVVASVRATVEDITDRIAVPYSALLRNGVVVRRKVTHVDVDGVHVEGMPERLPYDYLVLATGSANAFPTVAAPATVDELRRGLDTLRTLVAKSQRILVVGGGPVGVEICGEVAERTSGKRVVLAHRGTELLGGAFRGRPVTGRLDAQLRDIGVDVRCGASVEIPTTARHVQGLPRLIGGPVSVRVGMAAEEEEFDLVIQATGGAVNSAAYEDSTALAGAMEGETGKLRVGADLRVAGFENVFAIGDCASSGAMALAFVAGMQGQTAAKNIRALAVARARGRTATLTSFSPPPPGLLVTLGRRGGAGQLPMGSGRPVGPTLVRLIKGRGLFVSQRWKEMGFKGVAPHRVARANRGEAPLKEAVDRVATALGLTPDRLREMMAAHQ